MKKLSLSDFEYHISSTTRAAGQAFLSEGKVGSLREVERHFWVASVADGEGRYETEVIISPSKIKAFACECWSEQRKSMCAHIVASLLHLRKFLQQSAEEKARKAREKSEAQPELSRLSMQRILNEVPQEQLAAFVREYARRDRDFALAFKTRFAPHADLTQNPYKTLLASVLPKKNKDMKEADFKRIAKLRADLDNRAEQARASGDFPTLFLIAAAVLELLAPLALVQSDSVQHRLTDICSPYVETCTAVYASAGVSPELRENIVKMLLEMVQKAQFPDALQREVTLFLAKVGSQDASCFSAIKSAFMADTLPRKPHLSQLMLTVLAQKAQPDQALKVYKDIFIDGGTRPEWTNEARRALLELYYTQYWAATSGIIGYLLDKAALSPIRRNELETLRFQIAELTGDVATQLAHLRQYFLLHGRNETLDKIKQLAGEEWEEAYKWLVQLAKDSHNATRVAQLLVYTEAFPVLSLWIKEQGQPDLAVEFAPYLNDTAITEILLPLFKAHLDEHFGKPSALFVRHYLELLLSQRRTALVKNLIAALDKAYPERVGLVETLNEVFDQKKI